MKTISYKLKDLDQKEKKVTLKLGYVGENEHVQIRIDCAEIWKDYPAAVASLAVEPPEGDKYPAIVTRDGDVVCWTVKDSDLVNDGYGRIQLTFTEGSEIQKTVICRTKVDESIVGSGTAPDPIADFVAEANEALAELEAAEVHGPVIGEDGYWYTWSKDAGEYVKTDTKAQGEDGQQGPAGKDGADGAPGQDGHTPVKGTDYWTQQDQADIVAAAALETVSAVIDDTAGDGDTNKTWSADKIAETTGQLLTAIQGKPEIKNSTKTGVDLDISDENGNVLLRMKDGDIETENFKSADAPAMKNSTKTGVDLDFADPNGNVVLRCKDGHIETEKFNSKENGIPKCYVSPSGSDSNDGTKEHPFATFQKAINEGYKKIFASDGVYSNQQIVMDGLDGITILCNSSGLEDNIFESHKRRKRARIDNSIDIGELTQDGSIYKAPLTVSSDSSYYKVFISQTVDPVYSGSAYYGRVTTYNAILWEITDSILTCTRLVPKLTKVECEATQGTFFFDGDYIYINPTDGDVSGKTYKRLNLDTSQYGVDIRNCTDIHIQGIDIAFFPYYDLYFGHCEDITVKDCCFTFTCYGNTVEFNGADATVISCLAAQAGADGFGIAGYGDCSFYDCSAIRCYDDGISHHDGSTGVIDGGLWTNCLKGGVTPSYGSNVSVKNVVCKGNIYGIYYPQNGERITDAVLIMQNCLAVSNTTKDIKISGYDVLSHGCAYGTKEVDTGSTLTEYGNTVIS